MTRIETIFGGLFAIVIMAVVAFVFFGKEVDASVAVDRSDRLKTVPTGTYISAGIDLEEFESPTTVCECYSMAYRFGSRNIGYFDELYQSQLSLCHDRLGRSGSAAFDAGYVAATERPRGSRSCRPETFEY